MDKAEAAKGFLSDIFEKGKKWIEATSPEQNSIIFNTALSDAGMGAAVGAVGGIFTDQGIVGGAMSGAMLGAGAGALMKRSQLLGAAGSEAKVNRMTKQRDRLNGMTESLESKATVAAEKAGRRDAALSKAPLSSRIFGSENLELLNDPIAKGLDKQWKNESRIASKKVSRLNSMKSSLTKSIDAERAALSNVNATTATGGGVLAAGASLAFATLDSNRP